MLFRLSITFGIPVNDLEDRLSGPQLLDYLDYYELEPWGCEAEDWRHQHLTYTVAQSQSTKALDPQDFRVPWRRPKRIKVSGDVGMALFVQSQNAQFKRTTRSTRS